MKSIFTLFSSVVFALMFNACAMEQREPQADNLDQQIQCWHKILTTHGDDHNVLHTLFDFCQNVLIDINRKEISENFITPINGLIKRAFNHFQTSPHDVTTEMQPYLGNIQPNPNIPPKPAALALISSAYLPSPYYRPNNDAPSTGNGYYNVTIDGTPIQRPVQTTSHNPSHIHERLNILLEKIKEENCSHQDLLNIMQESNSLFNNTSMDMAIQENAKRVWIKASWKVIQLSSGEHKLQLAQELQEKCKTWNIKTYNRSLQKIIKKETFSTPSLFPSTLGFLQTSYQPQGLVTHQSSASTQTTSSYTPSNELKKMDLSHILN